MKSDIHKIIDLIMNSNETNTAIGRITKRDRGTIRKIRSKILLSGKNYEELTNLNAIELAHLLGRKKIKMQFNEPDWKALSKKRLRPGVTTSILYDSYVNSLNADNIPKDEVMSKSTFYERFRSFTKELKIEYREEHLAGAAVQIDPSGKTTFYTDPRFGKIKCEIIVAILPCSQLIFSLATHSQKLEDVIEFMVQTFRYFNGSPKTIVPDNLKAAVTKPKGSGSDAVINPSFQSMADHYGCNVDPTRVAKPTDKAHVENTVKLIQQEFLGKERYLFCSSLSELNSKLLEAVEAINNRKMKNHLGMSRRALFDEAEKSQLQSLPNEAYEFGRWYCGLKVPRHYRLRVEQYQFSVPYTLIGEIVNVKATLKTIEIYHASKIVAIHQKNNNSRDPIVDPRHMPENHVAMYNKTQTGVMALVEKLGPVICKFVEEHMAVHKNGKATYDMCNKFIRKAEIHGLDKLEKAVRAAIDLRTFSATSVYELLKRDGVIFENTDLPTTQAPTSNVRGAGYYQEGEDK